jgi:hypothetical protein
VAEPLRIGLAARDITPEIGEPLSGYIHREPPSLGVLDPLTLQALAVDDGEKAAVVIVTDLVGSDGPATQELRDAVGRATGVAPEHIVWHAVHTHGSPSFHRYRGMERASKAYLESVIAAAGDAAREAMETARPSRGFHAKASVAGLSHNRRRADGPIDDEASIVTLRREGADTIHLTHWQCHPVCLGSENRYLSGDYVGAFRRSAAAASGELSLYLNGCCGDLNPRQRGYEGATAIGRELAAAALGAQPQEPVPLEPLRIARRSAPFPLKRDIDLEVTREYLASERERLATLDDPLHRRECQAMVDWAEALLRALEQDALPPDPEGEIIAIRLGGVALVLLPCEALCAIGLALKAQSPAPITLPVSCTGKVVGYLGTPEEFQWGGYELDVAARYYSLLPFRPEAGQVLVDTALATLHDVWS